MREVMLMYKSFIGRRASILQPKYESNAAEREALPAEERANYDYYVTASGHTIAGTFGHNGITYTLTEDNGHEWYIAEQRVHQLTFETPS